MGRRAHSIVGLLLAALVAAPGCVGGAPLGVKASRRPGAAGPKAPAVVASGALAQAIAGAATRVVAAGATTQALRLTGKVKLLSNNGGGIISDNGGGIISNNAGAIISDNGGGVIANNGAGYRLAAQNELPPPKEFLLADAVVTVRDAKGQVLLDAEGRPLTATTDRQGGYVLEGAFPRENLVLEVKLWHGGTLASMLTKDAGAAPVDLDTASSIGARYVLGEFVKGDPATYDKLPAKEAERLHRVLEGARILVQTAPTYEASELVALGERLRANDGRVAGALADIKALLLGQANLGAGRQATSVPLLKPGPLAVAPDGTLFILEGDFGRIRAVAPDGTIRTYADAVRGEVKANFPAAKDLLRAPDGTLYAAIPEVGRVMRVAPDGQVAIVAGGAPGVAVAGARATETPLWPSALAMGADGTLYIGEDADPADPPRVLALGADGALREAFRGKFPGAAITGLATTADGFAYLETAEFEGTFRDRAVVRHADGRETELPAPDVKRGLARGPDGTVYVSQVWAKQVLAFRPDGTKAVVAGKGSQVPGSEVLEGPTRLATGPDGALHVLDGDTNVVYRLAPDGRTWAAVAGTTGLVIDADDLGAIPLNGPADVAVGPDGAMVVSENGSGLVRRFDGKAFTTLAGGQPYSEAVLDLRKPGEGIPAVGSCLNLPRGLAFAQGELLVVDTGSRRIRAIRPDGTIRTRIGVPGPVARVEEGHQPGDPAYLAPSMSTTLPPGATQAAGDHLNDGSFVAVAPDGRAYWTTGKSNQVFRERADGRVEAVTGIGEKGAGTVLGAFLGFTDGTRAADWKPAFPAGLAFGPDGALYVAEVVGLQVKKLTGLDGPSPTVAVVAGLPPATLFTTGDTASGDGGPATAAALIAPLAVCFDAAGNLYVSEVGTRSLAQLTSAFGEAIPLPPGVAPTDARIRKITPAGVITTVAGPGGRFFADPTAEDALVLPAGLAIDGQGRLYIADAGSNLVRILPAGSY